MIVSDSGPIIAFSRIGRLDILRHVFGQILIPAAVYDEVVVRGRGRSGSEEVAQSPWIQMRTLRNLEMLRQFPPSIHSGEGEAIALARELEMPLLIDEIRGRQVASETGVQVVGSLRVLAEARHEGIIDDVGSLVWAIVDSGYWISPELVSAFLEQLTENGDV